MFKSNIAIRKRFVSDYNLPIPIVDDEDMFMCYLNLYEDDFHSLTLYGKMVEEINTKFGVDIDAFLDNYYVPKGSWIIGMKVENDEVWNAIKKGEYRGFSIEGLFNFELVPEEKTEKKDEELDFLSKLV